ncbi:MAG: 50S ribosomal protein L29 [bacterium]|nr:50S ribosomal protein L29 [bacterium]MDE0376276.1 50S ribosomal protein L29 [bacterium]
MKALELRELTPAELDEKLDETKEELFNLRFQLAVSQSEDTASLGRLRQLIARIKTVMHENEEVGHA